MAINNSLNNAFTDNFTAPNKASKNLVIGGDFTTNPWQRGTTFTALATLGYNADRFLIQKAGTAVVDIVRSTDAPTVAQANIFGVNSLQANVTTADAAIAAGDLYIIEHRIEGYNFTNIAQRPFILSFWVKAVKTGIYCVAFRNSAANRTYVAEYTINVTNTWEYKTIAVSASPSAGTWNYTNGVGLGITFALAAGSTFQTTANSWNVGNFLATSNQVNGLDSNTNTFQLSFIQCEAGNVATPFEQTTRQQVLLACQRYYFKTFTQGVVPAAASGTILGALQYTAQLGTAISNGRKIRYPSTMRTTPTLASLNPINAGSNWYNVTGGANSGTSSIINSNDRGVFLANAQAAGDAAGNLLAVHLTAIAEL